MKKKGAPNGVLADDSGFRKLRRETYFESLKEIKEKNEASIDQFSYGVSDRGASIRIPIMTVENGWKGWLEDRRPASNSDPYKVAARIIKTVKSAGV